MPQTYDFVVVANRLPVAADTAEDGTVTWVRSPGGLVSALEPTLRRDSAVWVGWSGRYAPDPYSTGDLGVELEPLPDGVGPCPLVEIELTRDEMEGYYEGFSTSTLWPLYHDAIATPVYHRHHWEPYVAVNRRFAEQVAEIAAPGATVWVHDYQLQLVPGMLRERRPDLRIGFFLHIPFPPSELFLQLPWRKRDRAGPARRRPHRLPHAWRRRELPRGDRSPARRRARPRRRRRRRPRAAAASAAWPSARSPSRSTTAEYEAIARTAEVQDEAIDDAREARQPEARAARRRPPRLHQGHRRTSQGLRRAPRGRLDPAGRRRLRADRDAEPRERRGLPAAPRRDRAHGRSRDRRPRRPRRTADPVPAPAVHARGARRVLRRRRRHARDAVPRRHEPRRQGVRRQPRSTTTARSCCRSSPVPPSSSTARSW